MNAQFLDVVYELIEWSRNSGRPISRRMLYDYLKEKNSSIQDEELEEAFYQIEKEGIYIKDTDDEDYFGYNSSEETAFPADVRIATKNLSLDIILNRLRNSEIDMFPEFQRNVDLWSVEQKSRLIESLMLRIPIPSFYFDASDDNNWIVIDGLQRLSAFKGYIIDGAYKLTGMEYLRDEIEGLSFEELPRQYVRRILETQLSVYTLEKGTPRKIVFNIFKRLNTGGLVLESQEIRHALNQGRVISLLKEMADTDEFKMATGYSIKTSRMLDCEYATRFLAFTKMSIDDYKGNIDEFLDATMVMGNNMSTQEYDEVISSFKRTMKYCFEIFGKYSFRRVGIENTRGPVNKALFEAISCAVSKRNDEEISCLISNRQDVFIKYKEFVSDNANYLRSGDRGTVNKRMKLVDDFIGGLIDAYKY